MSKSTKTSASLKAAKATRLIVTLVATGVLAFVMWESRDHITHFWTWLGLSPADADDMWIFIDIPIVIGKLYALTYWDKPTKRRGFWFMFCGVIASLACNVGAGAVVANLGEVLKGILIVGLALALERSLVSARYAAWITGAKTREANKAKAAVQATAAVMTPQKKAALTRAANKAKALAAANTTPAAAQIGSAP